MNRGDRIREWVAAERFAVMAEDMVRSGLHHQAEGRGEGPSEEIQRIALERRTAANALLSALIAETQRNRDGA